MPTPESPARARLLAKAADYYEPEHLADAILALLEFMECVSGKLIPNAKFRKRTGIHNAPLFRGHSSFRVIEDAITIWISEFFPNASSQVTDLVPRVRPDIVLAYKRDATGEDILVVVEAKPVWQRWIISGLTPYAGETNDSLGRATGTYCNRGCGLFVADRDKLLKHYTHPNDRHMLLGLIFQRPGELDAKLVNKIGPGWSMRSRHVIDRSNPPGDNIGLTGMVFWPMQPTVLSAVASPHV